MKSKKTETSSMITIVLGILTTILVSNSFANEKKALEIKKVMEKTFPNTKIEKVKESEVKDLYEVTTKGGQILYTDGKHLIVGHIFTFDGKDITQEKIDKLKAKKISEIDLSKALKIGNGKQKVIEVADPQCPFCRRAEKLLENKDITRYVFFMPLSFHKLAKPLSIHILCSENPEEEYQKAMSGKLDKSKQLIYCKEGEKKLKEMKKIAKNLQVRGTPTFWVKTKQGWIKVVGANPAIKNYLLDKKH